MTEFQNLQQPTKRTLFVNGKSYLFFGGTAYLGLLDNPEYISLYKEGIDRYGLNNGTSRSNNVQLGVYVQAEEVMACRFGFESAAMFSSGYLAAQAAVRSLVEGKEVFYAPGSHPALWMTTNPQNDLRFEDWAQEVVALINHSDKESFVIISNCIDNLRPANFDFSIFTNISKDKQVLLILDDSHGLGIVHKNTVSSDISVLDSSDHLEVVVVSSLAKGLGTDAGVVLGRTETVNKVKKNPIFMGASPASPAAMYALIHGEKVYDQAYERLHHNIRYLESRLSKELDWNHIANFSVFTSLDPALSGHLEAHQILISSFPYPLPDSPLLNRVVISALHEESDLDYLLHVCV